MERTGERATLGGVDVYECPECGNRTAHKTFPQSVRWSPSIFEDHETVRIEPVDDDHRPYRVHTGPAGDEPIECRTERQAEDLAAVALLTGFRESETGAVGVPPSVARAGTPETVTYLLAHPESRVDSADRLSEAWGLDHETIRSHLAEVRERAAALQ